MSANQLTLWYLVASICFILALKGLSSPLSARRGNYFGIAGMTIAVLTTIAVVARGRIDLILMAMLIGGTIGLCASCGKRFLLKKLAFDAQTGQISVEIGMVLGSGNLASSSSPEQPTN